MLGPALTTSPRPRLSLRGSTSGLSDSGPVEGAVRMPVSIPASDLHHIIILITAAGLLTVYLK